MAAQTIETQHYIHGLITRAVQNYNKLGADRKTTSAVRSRIDQLERNWAKFERNHVDLCAAITAETKKMDYFTSDFYATVEEEYIQIKSEFLELLIEFEQTAASPSEVRVTDSSRSRPLPKISIPKFSGKFQDWISFRDLFVSLVGESEAVSNVEKLHYLKTNVDGEAAKLIASIPISEDNYDRAWSRLVSRYENKRVLVNSQLDVLFSLEPVRKKCARELEALRATVSEVVDSLRGLGVPVELWDYFLVYFISHRLDPDTHEAWELKLGGSVEPSTYLELDTFLQGRVRALECVNSRSEGSKPNISSGFMAKSRPQPTKVHHAVSSHSNPPPPPPTSTCTCCRGAHYIASCPVYQGKTPEQRKELCRSTKRCLDCRQQHHTSLHAANSAPSRTQASANHLQANHRDQSLTSGGNTGATGAAAAAVHHSVRDSPGAVASSQTLLATALVTAISPRGHQVRARALLDQGSEVSFIWESLVQSLKLPRRQGETALLGIGGNRQASTRGVVLLQFQNHRNASIEYTVEAHILPRITGAIPGAPISVEGFSHLQGLPLADPSFSVPGPIDILLGANIYGFLLEEEVRKSTPNAPVAQATALGWIISGPTLILSPKIYPSSSFLCALDLGLNELVQKFWVQENVIYPDAHKMSDEDTECEQHFVATHQRDVTGRYVVRLPFKTALPPLGDSVSAARRTLKSMQRRFEKDETFYRLYSSFLEEYAVLNHMEWTECNVEVDSFYLPHHGVLRNSSTTTKLRVVFNGSQKTDKGLSLNDFLHSGPKMQTDLIDILLRWRMHPYVFAADVEKMYRQISIHPDDRRYQKILWSDSAHSEPDTYQLSTVTYGLACAPFLAIRVLHQLAADEGSRFPLAPEVVRSNFYVDDVLSGAESVAAAREKAYQVDQLLAAGGFRLQKWAANEEDVLSRIDEGRKADISKIFEEDMTLRALGLCWNPTSDAFVFALHRDTIEAGMMTKRSVLSIIARLFDPLGWLAPVIVISKIFLQTLWKTQLKWDDVLPEKLAKEWIKFTEELKITCSFSIPRWVGTLPSSVIEIHGFSDASKEAVAAVAYIRVLDECFNASTSLLMAKTRVAPLKPTTVARLELSAAVLLAQLVVRCKKVLNLPEVPIHLWSDSSVTLYWIKGHASQWKEYVANRVALIHDLVPHAWWHHVPGIENPADAASRGLYPQELMAHTLWWNGPPWLRTPSTTWPSALPDLPDDGNLENRLPSVLVVTAEVTMWELINRYSSLDRLLRITARLFQVAVRFRRNSAETRKSSSVLCSEEREKAFKFWVRHVQMAYFQSEVATLERGKVLPKSSHLIRLSPFVDGDGLMRVGGRLRNTTLLYDMKHPFIIPSKSTLSTLLIADAHKRTLHGGVQLTLSTLRQRVWIVGGRKPVRGYILRCIPCTRQRGLTATQMMGQLPAFRTTPSRPFLHAGVDYAGPFTVRTWKGRSSKTYKTYFIVFICFSTSAVHLELASDYTTEGFLAAYRRFVGRRGTCATITSDQGTNLVGADVELQKMFSRASREFAKLRNLLASDHTTWRFNPPSAPHFGGKWEAAVKSAKFHLRRIVGDTLLTYEEFSTLLAQIEGILNSRPLCPLSDDPGDISALTPGHFLTGAPINAIPEPSLSEIKESRLSRWQRVCQMVEQFWNRWSAEYLQRFLAISKWHSPSSLISVGTLVVISDERYPPSKWPLARVVQLHPGADGLTRVVTVRTASGSEFKRPIVKLCVLPVEEDVKV